MEVIAAELGRTVGEVERKISVCSPFFSPSLPLPKCFSMLTDGPRMPGSGLSFEKVGTRMLETVGLSIWERTESCSCVNQD